MSQNETMHVTLYTVIGKFERIRESIFKNYSEVMKSVDEADTGDDAQEALRLHFHDDTVLQISINHNQQFMEEHLAGMLNYFAQAPLENDALKTSILNQITVFNCVIGCEFETNEQENRTNYIINTLFDIAGEISALLLFPSMTIFTSEGKVLLSMDGKSEFESYTPIGNADYLDTQAEETAADAARKERSLAFLREKGIPVLPHLKASVMESEASIRTPEEIAKRLFAIFAAAVYSEVLGSGEPRESTRRYLDTLDELVAGKLEDYLTAGEKAYLEDDSPKDSDIAKFSWRYEGCLVLLWALGYWEELPYPDEICDVSAMAKLLWSQQSLEEFLAGAKPQPPERLLDEADLILRMDWACVDARCHQKEAPGEMDKGVVYERHYAFNWLIGANGHTDWDSISPNT